MKKVMIDPAGDGIKAAIGDSSDLKKIRKALIEKIIGLLNEDHNTQNDILEACGLPFDEDNFDCERSFALLSQVIDQIEDDLKHIK